MPEEVIAQPTSIEDLEVKMCLEGVITRTELYGAFVDLGLDKDGLIHISRMARKRVKKVTDKVKVGDKVKVWITNVDPQEGRIGLTMVQPPDVDWEELEAEQIHKGRVVRMERYGVFVDIGAERPGLLHVRQMGQYVHQPSDVVHEGDEIEVRVIAVNRRKRQIDLSMELGKEEPEVSDIFGDEPVLSPMEMAFQVAEEKSSKRRHRRKQKQRSRSRYEGDFEDIYQRTLDQD